MVIGVFFFDKTHESCYYTHVIHYFLIFYGMTSLQKFGFATIATVFGASQTFAALNFKEKDPTALQGGTGAGEDAILNLIAKFLGFVTLIAVVYCLWAGFQILTAGGDEEKVKTGRKIIIQVIIGIVVMWLAYSVVSWVVSSLV